VRRVEFEKFLRSFEPLQGVQVTHESATRACLAPHMVLVKGIVHILGEPLAYETEVSLREMELEENRNRFVKALFLSFDDAEKTQAVGGVQ